jgi:ATP-binding cassette subfamily B multidrug efflux pump
MNKNKIDYLLLGRVLALAKPYRKVFILAGILTALLAPLAILRPYIIKIMVDDYIFKFDIPGLTNMAMLLGFILMIEVALRYVFIYSTSWLGQSVIKDLRVRMFNHISSLRLSYFDTTPIGTSTTRTINDIETINTVFSQGAITIIADLFTVFAVLTIMLITSWKLTLVCLTTLPFLMIATYIFKEKVKISYQKVRTQITRMNAFLQERISGMRIVQVFNAEEKELEKFKNINRKYTQANLDAILYYAVFFPVVEIISAAALGLLVWWGARGVIGGEVTTGTFIAFPIYLSMLFRPIRMLADRFNTLQMGLVASERVFNLLDKNDIIENNGTIKKESIAGDVEFDNVSFAYNNIDHVLNNLNFKINAGETLAICGSTGSGKTTIINILNRFYDIQKGKILIDDVNIRDYELFDLRKKIAIVLQDVFLFSGSVMENITLRDDRISEKEVIDAAKLIGAHEFIERLPSGYNYQVMERGATLSMGQRQLISFVRALVFNPESVIQYAIEKLIDKRTSIIIAHRLSTIRHADNIMVLNKGEIVELGAHDALIEIENGQYKELYEMQFMQLES